MKKIVLGLGFMAIAGLSLPVANLMIGPDPEAVRLVSALQDPQHKAAASVFVNKCLDCHSSSTRMPFYAQFPVAGALIQKDIADGIARLDVSEKLADPTAFSDIELARIEGVMLNRTMPPLRYAALHWNAFMAPGDEEALLHWIAAERARRHQGTGMAENMLSEPIPPLQPPTDLDPDKVALGDRLFHDKRLSADNTVSCASCHALNQGGTDQVKFSTGIKGQVGRINSPTVFNAVYNHLQFWDGRAADLAEQAAGPVHDPIEMGSDWKQVLAKLQSDQQYVQAFNRLYSDGMTGDNIADAIAVYEKSLVTPNSRFDQYLRGDKTALNNVELKGYQVFKNHCVSCHAGPAMGGGSFELMGRRADYFADRGNVVEADNGRFNATQEVPDKHFFKVPVLRNVAVTYPYFHDGSKDSLEEAVRAMAHYQVGKSLSEEEISQVVAFLKTLTGEYNGQPLE